jgi:hypothetical protein
MVGMTVSVNETTDRNQGNTRNSFQYHDCDITPIVKSKAQLFIEFQRYETAKAIATFSIVPSNYRRFFDFIALYHR